MIQLEKIDKQNTEKKETVVFYGGTYYKKSYYGDRVQITHNTLPKKLVTKKKSNNKEFHILVNGFYSYHINLILESLDYDLTKITDIIINEGVLSFSSPFGSYRTTEIKKY